MKDTALKIAAWIWNDDRHALEDGIEPSARAAKRAGSLLRPNPPSVDSKSESGKLEFVRLRALALQLGQMGW